MKHLHEILLFTLFIPFNLLATGPGYLTGEFENVNNDSAKVYLISPAGTQYMAIVKNKRFELKIPAGDIWQTYLLYLGKVKGGDAADYVLPLLLNGKSEMNLKMDSEFYKFSLSGDHLAVEQNQFYQKLFEINASSSTQPEIGKVSGDAGRAEFSERSEVIEMRVDSFQRAWVINHPNSPFSVLILRLFIWKTGNQTAGKEVSQLLYGVSEEVKDNSYDFTILSSQLYDETNNAEFLKIKEGSNMPDVRIKDTAGNPIFLKNFRGNYLFINFWASWCGPCKASVPMLHSIYDTYHSKGLQMISISMDVNEKEWKKAITAENMTWKQGSDLIGYEPKANSVHTAFDIFSVPQFFIISPEGKVLLRTFAFGKNSEEKIIGELNKAFVSHQP